MWIHRLLLSCLLAAVAMSAFAFERPFPKNVKRGIMEMGAYPTVVINDKARRLSAGARIWNRKNFIQMPASLANQEWAINYTEDHHGNIDRIWILTEDEAQRPLPKATPASVPPSTN
jgi:hypothetical protein